MCKGFDWAVGISGALMVNALTTDAVLLVVNDKCGGSGFEELSEWRCVRDYVLAIPEDHVFNLELLGAPFLLGSRPGVLSNTKEVVECNVA
jgi:hypothetical protein